MKGFGVLALRRLAEAVLTLMGMVVLTFLLMKGLPGGPYDLDVSLHPLVVESFKQHWGIGNSPWQQAILYIKGILHGDLGWSMVYPDRSVGDIIKTGFTQSILLNGISLIMIFLFSLSFSAFYFRSKKNQKEKLAEAALVALVSLPSLFIGPALIWLFSFYLEILPAAFLDSPVHYILPVLTLSLRPAAALAQILIGSLRDIEKEDYLRTARAKGLTEERIFWFHAVKNSLVPVLSYAGPLIVGIFSGSFLVEILFSIQGLGFAFVQAVSERDLPVILGLTLFYGAFLVLVSFLIDLLLMWIDPRIEEQR